MCVKNNDDFGQVNIIKYTVSLTPCEYSRTKNGKLLRHQTPNRIENWGQKYFREYASLFWHDFRNFTSLGE